MLDHDAIEKQEIDADKQLADEKEVKKIYGLINRAKTAKEIRAVFLQLAKPLLAEYVLVSLGKAKIKSTNAGVREKTFEILSEMLLNVDDTEKLFAHNTSDVLNLLAQGKITVDESKTIMSMLSDKSTIENTERIVNALENIDEQNNDFFDLSVDKKG